MNAGCHFNGTSQFHWGTGEHEETHRGCSLYPWVVDKRSPLKGIVRL